jgi:lipopolysaccharide export system permease protein
MTYLFLPLLAFPLGSSTRRTRRATGLAVGLVLVVIYHYLLQFGEDLTDKAGISPWIALWGPFAIYSLGSLWAFYKAGTAPGQNPAELALARLDEWFDALRHVGRRRRVA